MSDNVYVVALEVARKEFAELEKREQALRDRLVKVRAVVFAVSNLLGVEHGLKDFDLRSTSTRARRRNRL